MSEQTNGRVWNGVILKGSSIHTRVQRLCRLCPRVDSSREQGNHFDVLPLQRRVFTGCTVPQQSVIAFPFETPWNKRNILGLANGDLRTPALNT